MAGEPPSTCICNDGFYPHPDVTNCMLCNPSCFQCVGPDPDDCIECDENSVLTGLAPSECVCSEGSYMSDETGECLPCHQTCKNCTGPLATDCWECKFGAFLTKQGECKCYVGPVHEFTTETDASQCEISECSPNCTECIAYPWMCYGCHSGSTTSITMLNFCGCPEGFTYQPDTLGDPCVPDEECHYTCATCFAPNDPNACTSCDVDAVLRFDDRPTWCDCEEGTYPSWTTDNCVAYPPHQPEPCRSPCVTCKPDDPSHCLSCKEGAVLSRRNNEVGVCICKLRYTPEPDAAHCQLKCAETCKSCLIWDPYLCTSCIEGHVLLKFKTNEPSICVPEMDFCPENCCDCDIY